MNHRIRRALTVRAFTVVEILVAFTVLGVLLAMVYGLLSGANRSEARLGRIERAVAHAEIAVAQISADLRSILPPDPFSDRVSYRVLDEGRGITIMRLEESSGALAASPVTYETRPVGIHGNQQLYRNGVRLNGILLRELKISQVELTEVDTTNGNPVLRVAVTGIAEDLDPPALGPTGQHTVELDVPVPATSPAATRGLPLVARQLIKDAVHVRGTIQPIEVASAGAP